MIRHGEPDGLDELQVVMNWVHDLDGVAAGR
jgi:hypothetical protein